METESVTIRGDLREVEPLISRLISIGGEFYAKDRTWSHLKNKEDWSRIHSVTDTTVRGHLEDVYALGRDMCLFMSEALLTVNSDFSKYPTLTSIVTSLDGTWVYQDLEYIPRRAREDVLRIQFKNWATGQMLALFDEQLGLLQVVRATLALLKQSDLHKLENGMSIPEKNSSVNITVGDISNSAVAIHSANSRQTLHREQTIFRDLIKAIEDAPIENKEAVLSAAREMESNYRTGSWITAYKNFMSVAADHVQVIQPFLPALASMH
jgi:hypothetical protein